MTNPILIHAEQAKGKAFGDPHLVKRGRNCMKQCYPHSVHKKRTKKIRKVIMTKDNTDK